MADSRVKEILDQQSQLENDRSNWDTHWTEVAELCLPRHDEFNTVRSEGEKRTEKIFDATALLAVDRAASAVDSLITPATMFWHGLGPEDETLDEDLEVKQYLDKVKKILFRMRYRPSANFSSQAHECYVSLMAFGNDCLFVDDVLGVGIRYKSCSMSEVYIAENSYGMVDLVHRRFPMTARQAAQKFGVAALPEKIAKEAELHPFKKFTFIHAVRPAAERRAFGKRDFTGMPFSSTYVLRDEQHLVSEGGYRTFPYAVGRHVTAPTETYGRGPAMMVLPDIKMVNEMEKTMIRAAHKIVDPPLLAYGDGVLTAFDVRPNAINYGGIDDQGRQMVAPMKMGSNLPIGLEMSEQKRKVINDALFVTLFQILVQNPQMTATEALLRAQEKGQLLAPTMGRQQSEFLERVITRELDIASFAGVLPPMPDKLRKSGGRVKVVYTSPLARLRRAEDGIAIMRTLEQVNIIAQVRPDVWDNFDDNAIAMELADINGVPAKILRMPEIVAQVRAARQQAQQEAAQFEQAEQSARAFKAGAQGLQAAGVQLPQPQPEA